MVNGWYLRNYSILDLKINIGNVLWFHLIPYNVWFFGSGFMIGVICETDKTATYIALGTTFACFYTCGKIHVKIRILLTLVLRICSFNLFSFILTFFFSGALWPLEGMHWIIRSISPLLPITRCAEAFRALSVKGWPLSNSTVYQGFFSSFVWSCIFLLITWAVVKKNNGLGSKWNDEGKKAIQLQAPTT